LQGVFIDGTNTIVQEKTAQQDSERENSNVVVGILVECTKAFCVKNKHFDRLSFRRKAIDWFSPDPDSLNMNKSTERSYVASSALGNLFRYGGRVIEDLVD
jgi:hypothetical protein